MAVLFVAGRLGEVGHCVELEVGCELGFMKAFTGILEMVAAVVGFGMEFGSYK